MAFMRKPRDYSEPLPVGEPTADEPVPLSPPEPSGTQRPSSPDSVSHAGGEAQESEYVLEEPEPSDSSTFHAPPEAAAVPKRKAREQDHAQGATAKRKPKPRVSRPWNLQAELKPVLVGPLALIVLGLVTCTPASHVFVGVLITLAGLALTGYLVAVSLDRPVRVTPEQGAREYFECLDHHLPNFRRMYFLLTDDAKDSPEFATYPRFRAYWKFRLARLRPADGGFRPVAAKLTNFNAHYNRARNWARASYTLEFRLRGAEGQPLSSYELTGDLVKGADGMWYLNEGRIPEPESAR